MAVLSCLAISPIAAAAGNSSVFRVILDHRTWDERDPAKGDFLDCPEVKGPCQAVVWQRVTADEKVVLPRNKPLASLRFLTLKGIRVQGGDPLLTLALFATGSGDSVYMDINNDEDLANDGPGRFWPKGDSCVTMERMDGGSVPLSLCLAGHARHAGSKAEGWENQCEGMKSSVTAAICKEPPYRVRLLDLSAGTLALPGMPTRPGMGRRIALCDIDGDGRFRFGSGDRLVIDWDGDGILDKSLEGDGVAVPAGGARFRFSPDSNTFEIVSVDEKGGFLELRRLPSFDPAAVSLRAVEGKKAPDIRFVNLDGDTLRLSDFKGKKIMIQFWSTLCGPCLEDLSGVREFYKSFGAKNWLILSLTTETDLAEVQQAALKHNMNWMVGMAGPEARRYYPSRPLPLNVKINEQGILEKKNLVLGRRSF
ncbi:MAG: redoxin family protein [Fibrobacteria bacterium]